ncbi:MAG: hypothetical protein GX443_18745 [Deltaproteobacteria bacterium]|nr:hypothetical protein [Deltaproteobacteria bacterium]
MITNKDDEQKRQGLGLDVEAFEMQIDKEIDSLFVPGDSRQDVEETSGAVHVVDDVDIQVVEAPGPSAETEGTPKTAIEKPETPGVAINVEAFEMQIDKEIDSLFVPFESEPQAVPDFSPLNSPATVKKDGLASSEPKPGGKEKKSEEPFGKLEMEAFPDPVVPEKGPSKESPKKGASSVLGGEPTTSAGAEPRSSELPMLVEAFNIAYLSLDWEFTVENVSKLRAALEKLRVDCEKTRETQFLFKLLRSLLHRLKTNTDSVQPELIEIMRDAQESLKTLLLSNNEMGTAEREKLRSLVSRYRKLRDSFGEQKGRGQEAVRIPRVSPFESLRNKGCPDWSSMNADGWVCWLESVPQLNGELMRVLAGEERTVREIASSLSKTGAMTNLNHRLEELSSILADCVSFFREKQAEWEEGIRWLKDHRQGILQEGGDKRAGYISVQESPDGKDAVKAEWTAPDREADEALVTKQEQVFFFSVGGKAFAIPAKHVVKIDKIRSKKLEKILAKGFATLKELKSFYRSIRSGLLGAWHGLPSEVLSSYRFLTVPPQAMGVGEQPSNSTGIMLVSTGKGHGAIVVDSPAVVLHNDMPIQVKRGGVGPVLGTIDRDVDAPVEVIDVDALLRDLHQDGNDPPFGE